MNLDQYNYNVPEFVSAASADCFDTTADGAVVACGMRIDTPAAAWVASAEIRKCAGKYDDSYGVRKIYEACQLFGLTDNMFVPQRKEAGIKVSDGTNTAEFSVFDDETLNKAASELLKARSGLPYMFARECARELKSAASAGGFTFNTDNQVAIRKLAGDYEVDFEEGRKLLDAAVDEAYKYSMNDHAEVLKKIAGLCTPACSPEMAPYFITAIDEFYRNAPGIGKQASAAMTHPEDAFYRSAAESVAKSEAKEIEIADSCKMHAGEIRAKLPSISKWASLCGYTISTEDTAADVAATVGRMPKVLREEFAELFADK